jgi:hypothetical protein
MKRNIGCLFIGMAIIFAASTATAKDKGGNLSGTWDCQAHGGSQGDMAFTLYLQQNKEIVDGNFTSPLGGTQISSGTFRKKMLEIHIDMPQGGYNFLAKFEKGALSGTWSNDTEKGLWEGKKQGAPSR